MHQEIQEKTATIAINGTASTSVHIEAWPIIGIMVPLLISGTLEIQVSEDNTNWFSVKNAALTATLTTGATTGSFAWDAEELRKLRGYKYIKFVTGAAQTTTARVFTVVLKDDDR